MENKKKIGIKFNQNRVIIAGVFEDNFKYSYTESDEEYYKNRIKVTKKNGREEFIPVLASGRTICYLDSTKGKYAVVKGRVRAKITLTRRWEKDAYVFAQNIQLSREKKEEENTVRIQGKVKRQYACQRKNARVKRIVVETNKRKDENLPCNFYGREAIRIGRLPQGTTISAKGEIESRYRLKLLKDKKVETVKIYELKILDFQVVR